MARESLKDHLLGSMMGVPMDRPKIADSTVVLFSDEDVRQALKILDANPTNRVGGMREAMMFALKAAAINLDVK